MKFGVIEAWESAETENPIHYELHTFFIYSILACPAAFVSTWLDIEIHMVGDWYHLLKQASFVFTLQAL